MPERRLDLELDPPPQASAIKGSVLAARHRRALLGGPGAGREGDALRARQPAAERRAGALQPVAAAPALGPARAGVGANGRGGGAATELARRALLAGLTQAWPVGASPLESSLDDALVVPAGMLVRGYLRCRALLLAGDVVGNIHSTGGPVVVRAGATLAGRLVACGDVTVCGTVGDGGGATVISTRGKLTLASGARVDGDVRCARLELHDGVVFNGVARACPE